MSVEKGPFEIVDIRKLIREAAFSHLESRGTYVTSLEYLFRDPESLASLIPIIRQEVIKRGHDFDSFDLTDALIDEDRGPGEELGQGDNPPDDDSGGGTRVPRISPRPVGSGGAEVELEPETAVNEAPEHYFPRPDLSKPAALVPSATTK